MAEKRFITGNEAIARGTLDAGCLHYFGYPVTPQNEIIEFFAREMPKRGGSFVQGESEWSVGAMLFGAGAAGVRTLTSTAGPGWGLMQEMVSHIQMVEIPCVIVNVQRGGPGGGTTRHAQTDYLSCTHGGGHGGYKNIVLAPASAQENNDLVQLGFYLADKYRMAVVVLTDAIIGQMRELVELKKLEFGPLPEKDWALRGTGKKGGKAGFLVSGGQAPPLYYTGKLSQLNEKWKKITENEIRYQEYYTDDADLILVAFGYPARVSLEAINQARQEGLKVGMIRPITLWPFPFDIIKQRADNCKKFLVVEDNLGQMVDDVKLAVEGKAAIHHLGVLARHLPGELGMILPGRVYEEVKKLL